eukprot:SAG11_NODE_9120_length_941_cov_0.811164_1_plen_55_part_01
MQQTEYEWPATRSVEHVGLTHTGVFREHWDQPVQYTVKIPTREYGRVYSCKPRAT